MDRKTIPGSLRGMRRVIAASERILLARFDSLFPDDPRTVDALESLIRKILLVRLFSQSSSVLTRSHKLIAKKKAPEWEKTGLTILEWGKVYELAFAELIFFIQSVKSESSGENLKSEFFCGVFQRLASSQEFEWLKGCFIWSDFLKSLPNSESALTSFKRTRTLCREHGYVRLVQWLIPTLTELCPSSREIDEKASMSLSEQHEAKPVSARLRSHVGYPYYFEVPFDRRHVSFRRGTEKRKGRGGEIISEANRSAKAKQVSGPTPNGIVDWLFSPTSNVALRYRARETETAKSSTFW